MSWEQLRSIVVADAEERAFWRSQPPRSCPNDGTPLDMGPDGELHCQFDGYMWPPGER